MLVTAQLAPASQLALVCQSQAADGWLLVLTGLVLRLLLPARRRHWQREAKAGLWRAARLLPKGRPLQLLPLLLRDQLTPLLMTVADSREVALVRKGILPPLQPRPSPPQLLPPWLCLLLLRCQLAAAAPGR